MKTKALTIALAGNPNSGKTTLFNAMTGARQHVANYPGVTVEIKEGRCRHRERLFTVVDLPGAYSLTAYSAEEVVARNYILDRRPDVVIDVVDASNPERNLFLATQLMELGVPLVLAFNMADLARSRGIEFELGRLSSLMGVPIVETVGYKGQGVDALLDRVLEISADPSLCKPALIPYGVEIEEELSRLQALLAVDGAVQKAPLRWTAIKLLERDPEYARMHGHPALDREVEKARARMTSLS